MYFFLFISLLIIQLYSEIKVIGTRKNLLDEYILSFQNAGYLFGYLF